ncbi:Protein of unknown function DUF2452 [uncultured Caudovirales phage]|uniref:DUF2452 domain-containing protein n=1 Tax=uncultured Caudovirales phage TaxID=2100421 RepID=A0A6J5NKM3_9CAUD|nr:Protein of unknown function DUF2452 [uncultured Caudovirales phage]
MKKPDNVADNPGLLPYGSNIGAPAIKVENIEGWKQSNAKKVNDQFQAKFEEIREEYFRLIEDYQWNELVYSAQYNFEPLIGEVYHVYRSAKGTTFLSIVSPSEWNQEHISSFRLDSNNKWSKV